MKQTENANKKKSALQAVLDAVRSAVSHPGPDGKKVELPKEIPEAPEQEVIDRLIEKAAPDELAPLGKGKCKCPYATKRAIVESLHVIRDFAEEHKLAATVVRTLLTMLADMAIGAMKGKVSASALQILLNAFNHQTEVDEAYEKGVIEGRNQKIVSEYFPHDFSNDPPLPSLPPIETQEDL